MRLDNPIVGLSVDGTLRSDWHQGLLGIDFLSRFLVIFDYARKRVILEPREQSPEEFDMSGLFLVAEGQERTIVLRDVLAQSPASEAGLLPGDQLLKIDGAAAADIGLDSVRHHLKQAPGVPVRLTMARKDTTFEKQIMLRRLI